MEPSAKSNADTPITAVTAQTPGPRPPTPSAPPQASADNLELVWPRSAQVCTAVLLLLAVILLGVNVWSLSAVATRPAQLRRGESPSYRVNVNTADEAELLQLPGIGPVLARRIVKHRQEIGRFRNEAELAGVPGIGKVAIARLKDWVVVGGKSAADANRREAVLQPPPFDPKPTGNEPINVNTASAAELQSLPGIGPKRAASIIAEREIRPFISIDDLQRVYGIGPKTVARLRPFIKVD